MADVYASVYVFHHPFCRCLAADTCPWYVGGGVFFKDLLT